MRTALRLWKVMLPVALCLAAGAPPFAQSNLVILPLDQIKPGMKGVAYTIFEGDKIEPMDLEVLGILPNTLGPKQDIILIRLKSDNARYSGVVAGMSGSPVYIDGKLAGALSLRFGQFSKEPIAGVTPIQNMLDALPPAAGQQKAESKTESNDSIASSNVVIPQELTERAGISPNSFLTPIETPLVFSGFRPSAVERFAGQISELGLVATQGGTAEAQPDDGEIKAGDMVSMVLMRGALSLNASCTVTAVTQSQVFVCGHPVFGYGRVEMPMARGRVVTTLASTFNSFKIVNAGGTIGTITQDRLTAVVGRLGPAPPLVPVDLTVTVAGRKQLLQFEMIEHPKLTPLLVAIATFNGLTGNTLYSEGSTFRLNGKMEIEGHTPVVMQNMFAPTDAAVPDGFFLALSVQAMFTRIYTNPYERPRIRKISLEVEAIPERRWATIDSAWCEKSEVTPGETVDVKVLLRPYRGAPFIREVPITIPAQAPKGTLRIVVSDSEALNRMMRAFAVSPTTRLAGLEQLIVLMNKERRNNQLYVTLMQPTPTLLLEEKELPNAPLSQINILDGSRTGTSS
ncbi:MAG TPA: hypothetical protein VNL38_03330, partial [Candidatus Nitrosotenuis sp.]|nr:hypothetical protein [Candidatus Nitrosotenuis sp.]